MARFGGLPALRGERNSAHMAIKVATDATFEQEVLHNDRPVVVDFWAAWCGPCKLVAPEMEKIASKYEGAIDVVKVDVDANPGLSRAFNIMSIPTIAFFAPGKQPMGVVGFRPMEQLETQFNLASFPKVTDASASDAAASTTDTETGTAAASDAA
jgi:thioredoxin 1